MKYILKHWRTVLLIGIVVIAAVLRLYTLNTNPPALYWEEPALGYDAYSILKTGKDYHGNPFPIVAFPSFGDYKPPLYFYTIVPFIPIVGLNEWAVRLPSAVAGIATVLVVFWIGLELYGSEVGLVAAAVFAIQPWSIQLSRVGFETNFATFLVALGVLFLLKARKKPQWLIAAAVTMVLSMYTYHSERIVAPLLAIVAAFSLGHFKYLKWMIVAAFIAVVLSLPILINIKNPAVAQRAAETSIFVDLDPILESNTLIEQDFSSPLGKLLHHRYIVFSQLILTQYFRSFSPNYLFLTGDENIRHGTKRNGVLFHWESVWIAAALFVLVKKRKKLNALPIWWILIAAIPVSLTEVSPHTLRFAAASPAFSLLTALGIVTIYHAVKPKLRPWLIGVFGIVVAFELIAYLHFYYFHYPAIAAPDWQYGYKQLMSDLRALKKPGQKVYVTREQGRPSIYYLFYNAIDPATVQAQDSSVKKDQNELLQVGDYYFVDALTPESGSLVASSPQKRDPASKELQSVIDLNGKQVWSIWEKQ